MSYYDNLYEYVTTFYINSNDRGIDQLVNNFTIPYNANLKGVDCMAVYSFQFTGNVYTLTQYNNSLSFIYSGNPYTVTLPIGNYSGVTIATQLQTSMNNATGGTPITVTYTTSTNKLSFASTPGTLQLTNLNVSPSIGKTLGAISLPSSSSTFPQIAQLSFALPYGINLKYTSYVDIVSNKLRYKSKGTVGTASSINPYILARVPSNQFVSGAEIFHFLHRPLYFEWDADQLVGEGGNIDFSLYDEFGHLLDLGEGNIDFNMAIGCYCERENKIKY